jgi:alcohol dehydrogenase (NADP+)
MLTRDGTLCLVGVPEVPHPALHPAQIIMRRKNVAGSVIGGIKETQEMLDFCAEHRIVSDIELIPIQRINESYERMLNGDVRYRFVIDGASLREGA